MFRYFWWQQLWKKSRTRRFSQRNQRRHRLTRSRHHRFEPLEDRRLLAANVFDVTTTLDSADDGTEALTLREAIIAANASDGDDIINLPADTFTLGLAGTGENAAATGDLDISDQTGTVTIHGAGAGQTVIDAAGIDRVFDVLSGANVEIRGVTITGGGSVNRGGGIRNAGTLSIFESEISSNVVDGNGAPSWGGGASNSGVLTVVESLIAANTSGFGGGGIFNADTGTTSIINATISGNIATLDTGGGIHNDGTLTATNATVTNNTSAQGGGIASLDGSATQLNNTIVAHNLAPAELGTDLFDVNPDNPTITATNSVIGTSIVHSIHHGVNGNIVGQDETFDAGLLPLADNGGPTRTHALAPDSVAINAGDVAVANDAQLQFDQRGEGYARILGAAVDAGAFEFQVQEINLLGNGVSILAGDDTPSTDDDTEFGRVDVDGGLLKRTFTIENLGHRDLLLTGGETLVELTGSTAFSVTQPVSSTIGRDGSVTFDIAFDPSVLGWHKATVSIANNDEDGNENPYTFAVQGIGNGEIVVTTAVDEDGNEEVDTGLSLREAIDLANQLPGADSIAFDASLADSTIALSQEFGQLSISGDVTIEGPGAERLAVSGGGHSRVFAIGAGLTAAISDLTISGGYTADNGGGLYNEGDLTLSHVVLHGNHAGQDGGAVNHRTGTLNVVGSSVFNNTAGLLGGGLVNNSNSTAHISSSTFTNNSAPRGGAILNHDILTLTNTTVSGNQATTDGGGIFNSGGAVTITNSTIAVNQAVVSGGGIGNSSGTVTLNNSIVAGNTSVTASDLSDLGEGLFTANHSLIQDPGGHALAHGEDGNIVGFDPLLGPLADNGGPTPTHALLTGSPAIEAGDNGLLPDGLEFDQRGDGFVRVQGVHVDLGAFEFTPPDIELLGNDLLIPAGDVEPGVEDWTDFGGAYFRQGSVVHTFTIHNDSTGTLNLADDPVSIAGAQKKHFSVTSQPASLTLGPDDSTTFEITFNPKEYGAFTATISVASDDPDEHPYEFDVAGDGTFIVVDTLADEDGTEEASSGTSLREAIALANELDGADAIEFAAHVTGTISLTSGELTITEDVGIYGPGADALTVSGGGASRVFAIGPEVGQFEKDGGAEIWNLTIAGGLARRGGGIFNQGVLELDGVTLAGNKAQDELNGGFGGAIFNDELAIAWLFDSTVAGNMSDWFGGGVYNHANAELYVVGSTFSGNQAELAGGGGYNDGFLLTFNSTFSGNRATAANDEGLGGAFYNNGELEVQSSTLAFNQAGAGGAIANFGGASWLTNSVVSDNSATTGGDLYDGSADPPSIFGRNSLISDAAEHYILDGEAGNIVGVPAGLGPLADNGGWTQTHALLPGSPAIDATSLEDFDPEFDILPEFDQRGIERVQGERFDMGAFEVRPPEIDVAGNGLSIDNADMTPTLDDNTQFGRVEVDGEPLAHSFTIFNSGDHPIVLDGQPLVEIAGSDAFSISLSPDASIAGGDSATFEVFFDPSTAGVHTATVTIDNNDGDENPFQFTIQGVGSAIIVDVLGEDDGVAGTGDGTSLREAVELANYLEGADTIEFDGQLAGGTIALELGQLEIFGDLTINGLGADQLTVSRTGNKSRIFTIDPDATAEIRGLTLADGDVNGVGGAILNSGTLTIVDSAIVNSKARATNSDSGAGGGIFNDGGTLTITGSTISGNTALGKNNTPYGAYGGGIANVDGGRLTVTNSTISGNTANGKDNSAGGGGIINYGGSVTIGSSTIADNEAKTVGELSDAEGGGIFNELPQDIELGTVALANTIVAGNRAAGGADLLDAVLAGPQEPLVVEVLVDQEPEPVDEPAPSITAQHSLIQDADGHGIEDGVGGNLVDVDDPGLDPLGDNGGPTQTHALVLGSLAIDAGNNDLLPNGLNFDQRGDGFARVVGERTDIGAFEFRPPEIDVQGNATTIADGDVDPGAADHTDFGTVYFNLDAVTRTFTIRNTGGYKLDLTGETAIEISGEDAGAFEIIQPEATTIAPGGELTFEVTFVSREVGSYGATLSIANTDSDENPYDFAIQATYSDSILVTNLHDDRNAVTILQFAPEEMPPIVDHGTSLREAIWLADELEGWDTIEFDPALAGGTISLAGGELEILSGLSILGLGADQLTVSGNHDSRVFWIAEGIKTDISGLTIADGSDRLGGGIMVESFASVYLTEVALTDSSADWFGGGAFVAAGGELALTRSLISGNQAGFGGGGIHNEGWLTIVNSTVSGNTAGNAFSDGLGGGLLNYGGAEIHHATIADNAAGHGGGILNMEGDLWLTNTLVGNNSASDGPADVLDMNPGLTHGHHNLIEDPAGHTFVDGQDGNMVGRDPRLGKLADNGGPTMTHALLRGSRARDGGEGFGMGGDFFIRIEPLETDQRGEGFPRWLGEAVDIGALEAEPLPGLTGIGISLERLSRGEDVEYTIFADIALMNEPDYDPELTTVQWQSSAPDAEPVSAKLRVDGEEGIEVFESRIPVIGSDFGDHLTVTIDWDGEGALQPVSYQVTLPQEPQWPEYVTDLLPTGETLVDGELLATWNNPLDDLVTYREAIFVGPEGPPLSHGLEVEQDSLPLPPTPVGQSATVLISSIAERDLSDAEPDTVYQVIPLDGAADLLFDVKFFGTGSTATTEFTPVAITVDRALVMGDEGETLTNSGRFYQPDDLAVDIQVFDPDGEPIEGVTVNDDGTWSFEAVPPDDTNQEGTVTLTVSVFYDGAVDPAAETTFDVIVKNVAPTVMVPLTVQPLVVNAFEEVSFNLGSFFDPALLDGDFNSDAPFAVQVDWGDGSIPDSFNISEVGVIEQAVGHPIGELKHTYTRGSAFEVTVTVTDDEGDSGSDSFDVEVTSTSGIGVSVERERVGEDEQFNFFVVVDLPDGLEDGSVVFAGLPGSGFISATPFEWEGDWDFEVQIPLTGETFNEAFGTGEINVWIDTNGDGEDASDAKFKIQLPAREIYEANSAFANFTSPVHGSEVLLGPGPLQLEWTGFENLPPADEFEIDIFSHSDPFHAEDNFLEGLDFAVLAEGDTTFETVIPASAIDHLVHVDLFRLNFLEQEIALTPTPGFAEIDWGQKPTAAATLSAIDFTPVAVTVDADHVEANEGDLLTNSGHFFQPDGVAVELKAFVVDELDRISSFDEALTNQELTDALIQHPDGTWTLEIEARQETGDDRGFPHIAVAAFYDGNSEPVGQVDFTTNVHNVAPTVTVPPSDAPLEVNAFDETTFDLGEFSDPAPFDDRIGFDGDYPFLVRVDWGDGTDEEFEFMDWGDIGDHNHTYSQTGVFTVTVSATDRDGASGEDSFQVDVVRPAGIGVGAIREHTGNGDDRFGFIVAVRLPHGELTPETRVFAQEPFGKRFIEAERELDSEWDFVVELPREEEYFSIAHGTGFVGVWVDRDGNGKQDPTDARFNVYLAPRAVYQAAFPDPVVFDHPMQDSHVFLGTDLLSIDWTNPLPGEGGPAEDREIHVFEESEAGIVDIAFTELGADDTSFPTQIPVVGQPVTIEINALTLLDAELRIAPYSGFTPFEVGETLTAVETITNVSFTPVAVTAKYGLVRADEGETATNSGQFAHPTGAAVTVTASRGNVQQSDDSSGTWTWSLDTTDGPDESGEVTIRVLQNGVEIDSIAFDLRVRNLRPTAASDHAVVTASEGQTATNSGTFTEPVGEAVTLTANIGTVTEGAAGTWNWTFDTTDGPDDSQSVKVVATDKDGGWRVASFQLVVNNLAPSATVNHKSVTVTEGETALNSGTFDDPADDNVTITASVGTITAAGGSWNWAFDTTDGPDDTRTVTITATDSDGASSALTFDLKVNNVAPDVTVDNAAVSVVEGQTASNAGTFDDSGDDNVTITASVGSVTQDSGSSGNWTWTLGTADGPNETQTVTITATDSDGASSSVTFDLTVTNQAPVYTAPADQAAETNAAADFDLGSFTDPGTDGPWKVTVAWGDGTSETFTTNTPGSLGTRSHAYAAVDNFTVTVTVAEENGGGASGSATFQANVVAGFALKLDLGTGWRGTLADGFVELDKQNRYDATLGYGWERTATTLRRNNIDDSLRRDGHMGRTNTFLVDVPDGRYKVTITMGDQSANRGPTNVTAEGSLVLEAVSTVRGEFSVETFFVDVTDGQLDLLFEKDSGRSLWVVNAIEIESAAD